MCKSGGRRAGTSSSLGVRFPTRKPQAPEPPSATLWRCTQRIAGAGSPLPGSPHPTWRVPSPFGSARFLPRQPGRHGPRFTHRDPQAQPTRPAAEAERRARLLPLGGANPEAALPLDVIRARPALWVAHFRFSARSVAMVVRQGRALKSHSRLVALPAPSPCHLPGKDFLPWHLPPLVSPGLSLASKTPKGKTPASSSLP